MEKVWRVGVRLRAKATVGKDVFSDGSTELSRAMANSIDRNVGVSSKSMGLWALLAKMIGYCKVYANISFYISNKTE